MGLKSQEQCSSTQWVFIVVRIMCNLRLSAKEQDFCVKVRFRIGKIATVSKNQTVFSGNSTEEHKLLSWLLYSNVVKLRLEIVSIQAVRPNVTYKKPGRKLSKSSNKRQEVSLRRSLESLTSCKGHANELYGRSLTCDGSLRRFCLDCSLTSRSNSIFGPQKWVFLPPFLLACFRPVCYLLISKNK